VGSGRLEPVLEFLDTPRWDAVSCPATFYPKRAVKMCRVFIFYCTVTEVSIFSDSRVNQMESHE